MLLHACPLMAKTPCISVRERNSTRKLPRMPHAACLLERLLDIHIHMHMPSLSSGLGLADRLVNCLGSILLMVAPHAFVLARAAMVTCLWTSLQLARQRHLQSSSCSALAS